MEFAINLPINSVSFGQVGVPILRNIFKHNQNPCIFPIGNNVDLSTQKISEEFGVWLSKNINRAPSEHSRSNRVFKIWHLNGALESISREQVLLSFYELDTPTKEEINIVKNNFRVLFTCKETVDLFRQAGCDNVRYAPLGFDTDNFYVKNKSIPNRITFNLLGKLEKRKNHVNVLRAWAKKYGNNPRYFLNCAIANPFMKPEDQNAILSKAFGGQKPFNIGFIGFMQTNELYNDYLNSADIVIGMSGGEGWDLPVFHSVALGKHAVILNASGYKEWATKDNAILVEPNGKTDAQDGLFFHKGQPFNQGNIYTFGEDDFISACEAAISRVNKDRVNSEGLKLQQEFHYDKTCNAIHSALNE